MTDLKDYIDPVSIEKPEFEFLSSQAGFPHNIVVHTENNPAADLSSFKVALIGVPEGRNSLGAGTSKAPDSIREQLYRLSKVPGKIRIIDLGNMKRGLSFNDTIAGFTDVLVSLLKNNIFPVIIGGSSALVPAIDKAFNRIASTYTLITVDSRIDFGTDRSNHDSFSFLNRMASGTKSTLGHFINVGYQTYLNDQQVLNRFLRQKWDLFRIGDVRQAIYLTEPLFRDSHVAVFDISAVRQSDAPGTTMPSPNGFYGEEICLLARYAGISDKLKVFGLFDVNPEYDIRNQTSSLAAQIIWFFLEGFAQKQYESPVLNEKNAGRFIKYHVRVKDLDEDMIFIKSSLTERWWFEMTGKSGQSVYIACSHDDYLRANRNEVPDRWVKAANRLKS